MHGMRSKQCLCLLPACSLAALQVFFMSTEPWRVQLCCCRPLCTSTQFALLPCPPTPLPPRRAVCAVCL